MIIVGTIYHVLVHVYLHAFIHVAAPVSVCVSFPPVLPEQSLKYLGTFYPNRMGSLSGQHLLTNPQILPDT